MAEQFTFFWNGPFSQWSSSPFEFEGMRFNRAEQFMMFCKAALFEDYAAAEKIMGEEHPGKQKKIGRQVKRFDVRAWSMVARELVYVGNHCKFTQNDEHNNSLMKTAGTTLVEASPYDKIWGIGLAEFDERRLSRSTWQGKNWLGEVVTKVREDLKSNKRDENAFRLAKELVEKYKASQESQENS